MKVTHHNKAKESDWDYNYRRNSENDEIDAIL